MPKTLTTQQRLECAAATVPLLRILDKLDQQMSYVDHLKAVGAMAPDEPWRRSYRTLSKQILDVVAAVADQAKERLAFERIVHKDDGKPGKGLYKRSRIVTTPIAPA